MLATAESLPIPLHAAHCLLLAAAAGCLMHDEASSRTLAPFPFVWPFCDNANLNFLGNRSHLSVQSDINSSNSAQTIVLFTNNSQLGSLFPPDPLHLISFTYISRPSSTSHFRLSSPGSCFGSSQSHLPFISLNLSSPSTVDLPFDRSASLSTFSSPVS
jgi:hypothetical protein